jgi:hypothetical protein
VAVRSWVLTELIVVIPPGYRNNFGQPPSRG